KRSQKNGKAISTPGDGPSSGERRANEYPARLPDLRIERDLLPLSGPSQPRERPDRRLASPVDHRPQGLGLRPVLSAPTQREGLWLEPQADLPHLPGVGVESTDQAEEAPGARKARAAGGARDNQPGLVDGLHARPAQRWPQLPPVQRNRR